jgi:glyoxylase-like metal-dependent hydrolase (beta-lactamase superfamily II)
VKELMQKLAPNVYVEHDFAGVTVGAVVTPEGVICFDAPTYPADARRWRLKLAQLTEKPVLAVVNLDHHRDRVLGNQWLEGPVIAHELTSERLRQLPELYKAAGADLGADADLATDLAGARLVLPQVTFSERLAIVRGGHTVRLLHRPGVAPGAIWALLPESGIAFVGDAVCVGAPPPMQAADLDAWLASLAELRKARSPVRVIVPGRGAPTDKAGVKAMENWLRLVRRKVAGLGRGKKTRADAAALAEDLLAGIKVPHALREHYLRRLRAGLEHFWDTLNPSG